MSEFDPSAAASTDAGIVSALVPGGKFAFYLSKGDFEAICMRKEHKGATARCVLTKQAMTYKNDKGGVLRGGRPLGLMVAWLARGCKDSCDTKACHRDELALIDFKERFDARTSAMPLDGFTELLRKERGDLDDAELPFEPLTV